MCFMDFVFVVHHQACVSGLCLWAEVLVLDRSDLFVRLQWVFAINVFEVAKAHIGLPSTFMHLLD